MIKEKPLAWLHGEVKTPPFSLEARRYAGFLLRELQNGRSLSMPDSRPMPQVGTRVHELRINDIDNKCSWRVIYRIDSDAIIIAEVFLKKTQKTPNQILEVCKKRLNRYDKNC